MPSGLSFFTDEKTEPWVYEKYTEGHTVNAGGAGTQIQLHPENMDLYIQEYILVFKFHNHNEKSIL